MITQWCVAIISVFHKIRVPSQKTWPHSGTRTWSQGASLHGRGRNTIQGHRLWVSRTLLWNEILLKHNLLSVVNTHNESGWMLFFWLFLAVAAVLLGPNPLTGRRLVICQPTDWLKDREVQSQLACFQHKGMQFAEWPPPKLCRKERLDARFRVGPS